MSVRAYLGLGSNVGDRLAALQSAVTQLHSREGIRVLRSSRVYETEPVGGPPQGHFLNAVIEVETTLSPPQLLGECQQVELALGRERVQRWGPRTIDIDVLTYGRDEVSSHDPDLVIPHPRMHDRAFVLAPLLELDADPPLPGGRSLTSLRFPAGVLGGVRPFGPPLAVPQPPS